MSNASKGLAALSQVQLDTWVAQIQLLSQTGELPKYIPRLAEANPNWFALQIQQINGQTYTLGDANLLFPLMSVVKPFVLLFLLEQLGAEVVFTHVGMEPSNQPFNSLDQLQADGGFPRNPSINSGAIALCALLPGEDATSRCENLRLWLNYQAKCHLILDELMLDSVQSRPNERNRAIAKELANSGYLAASETLALETYERVCCLSGKIADLSQLGMLLVQPQNQINPDRRRIVKAILTTCGLYERSSRFAVEVGLPTKSGVSGAMLSVVPGEGAIAIFSPPLDSTGNSVAGLWLLKQLSQQLNLSIFA